MLRIQVGLAVSCFFFFLGTSPFFFPACISGLGSPATSSACPTGVKARVAAAMKTRFSSRAPLKNCGLLFSYPRSRSLPISFYLFNFYSSLLVYKFCASRQCGTPFPQSGSQSRQFVFCIPHPSLFLLVRVAAYFLLDTVFLICSRCYSLRRR